MSSRNEIPLELIDKYIRKAFFGMLGTVSPKNRPHVAGVAYGVSEKDQPLVLYVVTRENTAKVRNIRHDNHVSFLIPFTRRILRFLPPPVIHFQGTAELLPFSSSEARTAFRRRLALRTALAQAETNHQTDPSVFIKIRPDRKIFSFALGLKPWDLLKLRKNARMGQQVSYIP